MLYHSVFSVIFWVPDSWKSDPDNAVLIAEKGIELLTTDQGYLGSDALRYNNDKALRYWFNFLKHK